MKANEAPEKIYLHPYLDSIFGMTERSCESEIEYTRTDAFIEKACEYLNNTCRRFILTEKDIEDFKNFMEGE